MGCDIHMRLEKKVDDKWVLVTKFKNFAYKKGSEYGWEKSKYTNEPYSNRNYDVFAILGDVRNGRGFAGVPTGGGFNPISSNRGVPEDATKEYRKLVDYWEGDGHSHSWVTLKELLEYDWNQTTTHEGVVDSEEYKVFKKNGSPSSYSGGVFGVNVKDVSVDEMQKLLDNGENTENCYCKVRWSVKYSDCAKDFLEIIPELQKHGKPEDVRLVFFSDN